MTAYHKKAPQPFTFMTALNFSINVRSSTRADFNDAALMDGVFSSKAMFAPNLHSSGRSRVGDVQALHPLPGEAGALEDRGACAGVGGVGGGANARLG